MAKVQKNFLELVPEKNENIQWILLENKLVQLQIARMSILDRFVRLFAKTPSVMKIDLDEFGSFIWLHIDGKSTTDTICNLLKDEFGDRINPLYERFGKYIAILKNNKFIRI